MFLCFSSGGDVELGVSYGGKTKDLFLPKIFGVGAGGVCFGGPSVRYVFPDGVWLGETASSLWNKVLQTSLSFAGICSGAGVGSVSSCTGASVTYWAELVLFLLCVLVLCSGSPRVVGDDSGYRAKSERSTADGLFSRISCSLTFGVHLSIWVGKFGGLKIPCAGRRPWLRLLEDDL